MGAVCTTQFERDGVINRGDLLPELQLNTEYEPLVNTVVQLGRACLCNRTSFNSNN
jgi:hypothetical protein